MGAHINILYSWLYVCIIIMGKSVLQMCAAAVRKMIKLYDVVYLVIVVNAIGQSIPWDEPSPSPIG